MNETPMGNCRKLNLKTEVSETFLSLVKAIFRESIRQNAWSHSVDQLFKQFLVNLGYGISKTAFCPLISPNSLFDYTPHYRLYNLLLLISLLIMLNLKLQL